MKFTYYISLVYFAAGFPLLLGGLALALGCDPKLTTTNDGNPRPAPDFELTDLNASSPRFQQTISPRDYLGGVSAWYFGHAT